MEKVEAMRFRSLLRWSRSSAAKAPWRWRWSWRGFWSGAEFEGVSTLVWGAASGCSTGTCALDWEERRFGAGDEDSLSRSLYTFETASLRNDERLPSDSRGSHFVRPRDCALWKVDAVPVSDSQSELRHRTAERPSVRMYEVHSSVWS